MRKLIDYPLSILFLIYFGLVLVVFHGVQIVCYHTGGNKLHQKSVNVMNWFLISSWYLTGSTVSFRKQAELPLGQTIIFIANHQSMFDIPGIIWHWRKHTPLFVSKKELAKGIPGISYNLRVGHAALIDRNDKKSAIVEIARLGKYICENKFSACIFPEGTRSRTGEMKTFQVGGIATLLKRCPSAIIVPIAIENTAKFNPKGIFPVRAFTKMHFTSLLPIATEGRPVEELVAEAKAQIQDHLDKAVHQS
ncbi:1-acyl-sn-glycerol-3-phosphate acyltransferase [Marinilongibacter aquaticus]|uniref:lysophospholipid acyltransferase family protein n=1 Tax=Marinilongibacter aquaticus TaxID=2975157 RepID=UPI0021BD5096|nr:lysophospholipid acyltransferase family protein [Marinilongibacter aquaticus]UBM60400.1 1-acyl-sn-glycerol-3-phosphate acyltransferase [Marinilongibacter aquaticus]